MRNEAEGVAIESERARGAVDAEEARADGAEEIDACDLGAGVEFVGRELVLERGPRSVALRGARERGAEIAAGAVVGLGEGVEDHRHGLGGRDQRELVGGDEPGARGPGAGLRLRPGRDEGRERGRGEAAAAAEAIAGVDRSFGIQLPGRGPRPAGLGALAELRGEERDLLVAGGAVDDASGELLAGVVELVVAGDRRLDPRRSAAREHRRGGAGAIAAAREGADHAFDGLAIERGDRGDLGDRHVGHAWIALVFSGFAGVSLVEDEGEASGAQLLGELDGVARARRLLPRVLRHRDLEDLVGGREVERLGGDGALDVLRRAHGDLERLDADVGRGGEGHELAGAGADFALGPGGLGVAVGDGGELFLRGARGRRGAEEVGDPRGPLARGALGDDLLRGGAIGLAEVLDGGRAGELEGGG
ncbi:MAG: hypothetical protein QM820_40275 [Minicystis sp.]